MDSRRCGCKHRLTVDQELVFWLLAKAECLAPKLCFFLKLVVPELVSVVFCGVWRLEGGKRSTSVIGFAVAGSEEEQSGQYGKLESFHGGLPSIGQGR